MDTWTLVDTMDTCFLTALEAGIPRSRYMQCWFLVRPLFLAFRLLPVHSVFTLPFLHASEERGWVGRILWCLFLFFFFFFFLQIYLFTRLRWVLVAA